MKTAKNRKPDDYSSVQKALQIVLAFVPHNPQMGTLEISDRVGIHKSTVSRLIGVLTYYGFLQQDPNSRKYMLGKSAAGIGTAIRRSLREHLVAITQPHIDALRNQVGETVALEVWTGKSTILAYRAEALHLRREFLLHVGDRVDVHISAGARVIMAFSPPQIVEGVFHGTFPRYTANTITDSEALKSQLGGIRKAGYARSSGERHMDSENFAVPVFNHEKKPVAAVVLFSTSERAVSLIQSDAITMLKRTAADISEKLLYSDDANTG